MVHVTVSIGLEKEDQIHRPRGTRDPELLKSVTLVHHSCQQHLCDT